MNVMKQNMRFLLMSLLLFVCGVSMAQTQVVFEAGVDKGATNSLGNHHIDKDGVTFGGSRVNLANNPYDFQTFGGPVQSQKLTVSSTVGNIQKIEIEGKNLSLVTGQNVGTFDASTGVWDGNSNNVELTIKYTWGSSNKVTVSKVTVTLASSVATTLSFGEGAQASYTVYKSKETDFTPLVAKVIENNGNTEVKDATVKYSSSNTSVVSVNETTGDLTYGVPGEATITASYDGKQGVYDAATSISYIINYKKNALTLAYTSTLNVIYADDKDKFIAPTLNIKSNDTDVDVDKVVYESSNNEVASVAENGTVKLLSVGEATITATVKDNILYEDATASYTIRIADPENIFSESFDNVNGEGGNDDNWDIDKGIEFNTNQCDNDGWSKRSATTFQAVTGGNQCMNIYGQANLYSPELKYLNGSALLTFRAGADKAAVLTVTVNGKESKFNVPAGEFKEFSMPIEGTPSTKIDFYGYWTAGGSITGTIYNIFIDDVKVVKLVSLSDNTDNTTTLEANNGKNVNILLNRKLSNEYWNTLCLPFDMTEEQVAEHFGAETKIREFNRIENGELVFVKTTNIAAGKPYLVKPENTVSDNVLLRSTINNTLTPSVYTDAEQKEYQFIGVVSPTPLTDNDVFIGTDNNLYYPDMDTEGANIINGMRAYIKLPEGTDAKSFVMNFDGNEATGINRLENTNHNNGLVYTISGQLVGKSLKNINKGVYIMNGKKIVVK